MADPIVLEGEWLRASHAAARLGVGKDRLFKLVRDGRLGFRELPTGRVYSGTELDALRAELDTWPGHKGARQPAETA